MSTLSLSTPALATWVITTPSHPQLCHAVHRSWSPSSANPHHLPAAFSPRPQLAMSTAAHCAPQQHVPVTPTKCTAAPHPQYYHTPRGLHTVPQPFHFNSSHRSQAPATPSLHPSHKENSAPVSTSFPATQPLKSLPSHPTPLPPTPTPLLGSRTPQSLFPNRPRMPSTAAGEAATTKGGVDGVESMGTETSTQTAAAARVSEDAVSRRLDAEFSVDATSLAAILAPAASLVPVADFTTSDRQSILVAALHTSPTSPQLCQCWWSSL